MGAQELWTNNSSRDGDKSMNLGLFLEVELTESVVRLDVNLGRKKRIIPGFLLGQLDG